MSSVARLPRSRVAGLALVCLSCLPGGLAGQSAAPPSAVRPGESPVALARSAVEIADGLLAENDMEGSYAALVARLEVDPDDFEARWRAARGALGFGIMGPDRQSRTAWLRVADQHGHELLRVRPDHPEALAWAAAARGRRALAEESPRLVVNLAKEAWQLTGELLAMRPDHPLGNHVRGKLHQEVARLSTVKRFLARLFLGGGELLGEAKWSLAEEHLQRAIAGDPGMVLFYLDLGETYRYEGKLSEALAMYRRGLAVEDRLPVDGRFKATMRNRITTLEGSTGMD